MTALVPFYLFAFPDHIVPALVFRIRFVLGGVGGFALTLSLVFALALRFCATNLFSFVGALFSIFGRTFFSEIEIVIVMILKNEVF